MRPGAFAGVALADGYCKRHADGLWVTPESVLPLPTAVLIYDTHAWSEDCPLDLPVGVAVPAYEDGMVTVRGVLASGARAAWNRLVHGIRAQLSVVVQGDTTVQWNVDRDRHLLRAADWTLASVDLVRVGADTGNRIDAVWTGLSPAEHEVQTRLDSYLADPSSPLGVDLLARAAVDGEHALDALAEVVSPLNGPREVLAG